MDIGTLEGSKEPLKVFKKGSANTVVLADALPGRSGRRPGTRRKHFSFQWTLGLMIFFGPFKLMMLVSLEF